MTARSVMEWQPIENAPKNTLIDIWVEAKRKDESGRRTNFRLLDDGTWFGPHSLYTTDKVTHWMLPPGPPKGRRSSKVKHGQGST